jgi:hypothetical protein
MAGAFDYQTEAELFAAQNLKFKRQPLGYRRFAQAADAIRFAMEELPPGLLLRAYLEVDEERFDGEGIRRLYESQDYPLARRAAAAVEPAPADPVDLQSKPASNGTKRQTSAARKGRPAGAS